LTDSAVPRKTSAPAKKAAARKATPKKAAPAAKPPTPAKPAPIVVDSHRALLLKRDAMVAAIAAHPELLPLLAANPVLAFRDAGVKISPDIATHVLHALQYPPAVREERDRLIKQLRKPLGGVPRPRDPTWLADVVFGRLKVSPLQTSGHSPTYVSATPDDARKRIEALLPKRPRVEVPPLPEGSKARQPIRRLDLDAPTVDLPVAARRPKTLTLEALWFYRGSHELVTPLLRLGVIESSGLPFLGADSYRKLKSGERPNALVSWVQQVQFPPPKKRP
jgi:hypothetical protein